MSDRVHSVKAVALAATLAVGSMLAATSALAQDAAKPAAKPAEKAAAPAADKAAAPAKDAKAEEAKTAWYKICAKVPVPSKDAEGKETKEEKNACTTFYESFNPATGAPLVYVAVEEGEGVDKKVLTVVVPPGLALPPGMAITVFQKDQWEKFVKENKEGKTVKPEDVGLKPVELKYLHCHQTGCASVSELGGDFLEQMKTGVGMIVRAVELNNKVVDFPVPLKGFTESYGGAPVDTKEFMQFRTSRLKEMQERRAELVEKYKKARADMAATPAPPGDKAAAPAAKPAEKAAAPAEKK
jgi:invasion protein IalB